MVSPFYVILVMILVMVSPIRLVLAKIQPILDVIWRPIRRWR
ncbi:hypothetical protein L916_08552 [Phytophthora nicotianae]|uniref:Uncharacterized protein n=1 Tax=Phytophthora nicotianae TaxID=4792 RepID=W2J3A6_PHYNI|nr:hypothetical protein L916_08552 [Phytophthora nicotianae]